MPVSVEEYLRTRYEPDCDYVDGELVDRNAGLFNHSNLMMEVCFYLRTHYQGSGYIAIQIQRVQVGPTRYRVPDVCVCRMQRPMPQIFRTPPVIVIEILSPEDRVAKMQRKIDDYLSFGVPNVWLIDPEERRAFIHTREGSTESMDLILRARECDIVLPLPEVFAALQ